MSVRLYLLTSDTSYLTVVSEHWGDRDDALIYAPFAARTQQNAVTAYFSEKRRSDSISGGKLRSFRWNTIRESCSLTASFRNNFSWCSRMQKAAERSTLTENILQGFLPVCLAASRADGMYRLHRRPVPVLLYTSTSCTTRKRLKDSLEMCH